MPHPYTIPSETELETYREYYCIRNPIFSGIMSHNLKNEDITDFPHDQDIWKMCDRIYHTELRDLDHLIIGSLIDLDYGKRFYFSTHSECGMSGYNGYRESNISIASSNPESVTVFMRDAGLVDIDSIM